MTALGSWAAAIASIQASTSLRPVDIRLWGGFDTGAPQPHRPWKRKRRANPKRDAQAAAKRARKDGSRRRNGRFAKPSRTGASS